MATTGQLNLDPTITARQAQRLTSICATWEAHGCGAGRYRLCAHTKSDGSQWVRGVNAEEPRIFASLDTVRDWLHEHADAGDFRVYIA